MNTGRRALSALSVLALALICAPVFAQSLFFDDFEDRVQDQPTIGNNWTWYDQWWDGDTCVGEPPYGFGPFDDGNDSDYVADNRNYWTADVANGGDGNYYRAGLQVPAWDGAFTNMLRVYGNVYNTTPNCQRVLIFQERTIETLGAHVFSFDVVPDQDGAPENGEYVAGFVKVLDPDNGYETVLFETVDSDPQAGSISHRSIEFDLPEELAGKLLQFGFYNDHTPSLGQSWDKSGAYYDNVRLEQMIIGPAHSGSWWNRDQSGHGFSIEFANSYDGASLEDPIAVVYWYTFDSMGNSLFMIGVGTPVGNRLELTFYAPEGMMYGVWNKPDEPVAGTAVLDFTDRDNAVFSYTPSEYSMTTLGHASGITELALTKLIGIAADNSFPNPVLP